MKIVIFATVLVAISMPVDSGKLYVYVKHPK